VGVRKAQPPGASVRASLMPKPTNITPARRIQPMHGALHRPQAARGPGSQQRVAHVDGHGVDVEQHTQQHERQRRVAGMRGNELRHKSQKKQRHLGVEHVGQKAFEKYAFQMLQRLSELVIFSYQFNRLRRPGDSTSFTPT
jgi:hypothetical protein